MSQIAIGILTYKRMEHLYQLLGDLNKVKCSIDLIILNNNDDIDVYDEIYDFIDNENINLKYIWHKKNYGVAKGRKVIVSNCSSEYLILLDDDVFVEDINKICECLRFEFKSDKSLGGIAFKIVEYATKKVNRFEIPHKNKKINLNEDFYTYLMIGAGLALRVSSIKKIGNFSDTLGPYGFEEIDIAFRLINGGYKIKYLHNCVVEHKKSPDGRFSNEMINYYALVNRTTLAKLYLKKRYYLSCLIVRTLFFMLKTRNVILMLNAWREILKIKNDPAIKFNECFYVYCKKVNAFLYY